ncbi:hypothetical protein [Nocardia implantans]|uniref:Uncharacterized protein n=1 Tax=Nocardia implantans TaxID=3108168 RepID=A0ABU6B3N4_9NOCA|nr:MULTISPECIES: hypothetical protein [unclassified Nocardia]MBF6195925.1 hypothetical protein [Nocardia beijingensis]MEA3532340.1 hypothetical protein [Nocardia sp. CDC192]MEB3514265.1 hypothetical protein [Nocardia sp. CDC186]
MSTESERRPYGDGAEGNSTAGESRAESRYDGTGAADRPQTGPVVDPAAVEHESGQVAASGGIDDAERAQATGAPGSGTPAAAAAGAEPVRADAAARQQTIGTESGGAAAAEQAAPTAEAAEARPEPLFPEADLDRLRTQWREVQVAFVDDPRAAVDRADELLGNTIHQLTATYEQRKHELDSRLGDTSDTEGLRQALRGYRAFFDQLLSIGG